VSLIWTLVVILVVLALCSGALGTWGGVGWGAYGWSPLLIILLVVCILFFAGVLR
jgi:hypothetical protein